MEGVGRVQYINRSQFQGKLGYLFRSCITQMQGGSSISNNVTVFCKEKEFVILVNLEQTIFTSTSTCRDELFTAIKLDVWLWDALTNWMFRSRKKYRKDKYFRTCKRCLF
jgi:hypothetical protein